jgi:hypothetical protein
VQKEFDKANEAQLALEISRARGRLDGIVANADPDCRLLHGRLFRYASIACYPSSFAVPSGFCCGHVGSSCLYPRMLTLTTPLSKLTNSVLLMRRG